MAQRAGTAKCRPLLLEWLRRGDGFPAWIISTFLEMYGADDPEFRSALTEYIRDDRRRADAVRWLDLVVGDQRELGTMLRAVMRGDDVLDSHHALEILAAREGVDAPDLWPIVEEKLTGDKHGHYWRLGHRSLLKICPAPIQATNREIVNDSPLRRLYQ